MSTPVHRYHSIAQGLQHISERLAKIEKLAAASSLAVVFVLLLLNIVTRAMAKALFWVDEAAIVMMIWMAFFACLFSIHQRSNIAVSLLTDLLGSKSASVLLAVVDLVMLGFFLILVFLVWNWFAPHRLLTVGGDLTAFSMQTFNFIYEEPTQTLGFKKFWVWLILPWFALSGSLHCLANLSGSLFVSHPVRY